MHPGEIFGHSDEKKLLKTKRSAGGPVKIFIGNIRFLKQMQN